LCDEHFLAPTTDRVILGTGARCDVRTTVVPVEAVTDEPYKDYASSFASSVISVSNSFETGQRSLALCVARWKASSEAPGIFALRSRWLFFMAKPAPSFSSVIVQV